LLAELSPRLAGAVLRLCAVMSWTPGRLLASPAAEVERLLALMQSMEVGHEGVRAPHSDHGGRAGVARGRPARAVSRRPRIADYPDAVVITFADDSGGAA
jgi:hypothetical protein